MAQRRILSSCQRNFEGGNLEINNLAVLPRDQHIVANGYIAKRGSQEMVNSFSPQREFGSGFGSIPLSPHVDGDLSA
jgi:hypothetical protein